jgi:hypothetical protein
MNAYEQQGSKNHGAKDKNAEEWVCPPTVNAGEVKKTIKA